MQRNWIGKSEGARVTFELAPEDGVRGAGRGVGDAGRGMLAESPAAEKAHPGPPPPTPASRSSPLGSTQSTGRTSSCWRPSTRSCRRGRKRTPRASKQAQAVPGAGSYGADDR